MSLAPLVVPRRHPRVVEATLDGARALFHLDDRRLHLLNPTAAAIWDELDDATTLGALTGAVAERFGVAPDRIRVDVARTVEQFGADRLATTGPAPTPTRIAAGRAGGRSMASPDAPASGSWAALGARVALWCDDPEVAAIAASAFAPLAVGEPPDTAITVTAAGPRWRVAVGDRPGVTVGSRLAVVLRIIGELNAVAVDSVPDHLVLHAGAVADDRGAVLLPAASNAGKSTLTTALVADGLAYLTDEAAAIGDDGRVRPFPKAVSLDPGSFPLFPDLRPPTATSELARVVNDREWQVDPARIGSVGGPATVRLVVCPQWRAGTPTRVHRVPAREALPLLLGQAFDFGAQPEVVFPRLARLAEEVPVYRLGYGDLVGAVAAVRDLLGGPRRR